MKRLAWIMTTIVLLVLPVSAAAQMDTTGWRIEGEVVRLEEYQGKMGLLLHNGRAWLPGPPFQDGVVEFDIAFDRDRGFNGVGFRAVDDGNFEHYYLRPHQSGNPDATQYTPVYQGYSGWQLYAGERYSLPLRFRHGQWMHVKLVFQGTRGAVYLDSDTVAQPIPALVRAPVAGGIFLNSSFAPARFANVVVRRGAGPPLQIREVEAAPVPAGAVTAWRVSNSFPLERIGDRTRLGDGDVSGLRWGAARAGERGFVNLAEHADGEREHNTILAGVTLRAERARTVLVRFGFSDQVRVYLNGRLLYAGDDTYQSRDYRFLGTVGYFDTVVLPLEAGRNSLLFAVSEGFGGWVVGAVLEPTDGVRVGPGCDAVRCGR